jgi:hypothetical protein
MRLSLVLLVAACKYNEPLGPSPGGDDAPTADAPPDIAFDGPVECYGTGLGVNVCLNPPTMDLNLMGPTTDVDTDHSPLCVPANPTTLCVLAGKMVSIDTHLVVVGSRPLVIVATGALSVKAAAIVDVASHHGRRGPGSDTGSCGIGTDPDMNGGGGGRGGSLGSAGGNGGTGNNNGIGAIAGAAQVVTSFRGGCPGSDGGGGGNRGAKGHGGGAVYLFGATSIQVDGTIDASGGGGSGAGDGQDGGGGGGSGGVIVFDTPTLGFAGGANIYANGGGGGEGSAALVSGGDGSDPNSPTMASSGGGDNPLSNAGVGGDGSVGTTPGLSGTSAGVDTTPQLGLDGGGGGGGGGGAIFVFQASRPSSGHVSPPIP